MHHETDKEPADQATYQGDDERHITTTQSGKNGNKMGLNSISNDSIDIPQCLEDVLPIEKWNSLSQSKKQACFGIFRAPNTFFYRSRPPWEEQKLGSLSKDEESMFFQRLDHFKKDFGINNSLWGYFAIPFIGRVGYQLASYYRVQIKAGKIVDPHFHIDGNGKLVQSQNKMKADVSEMIHRELSLEAVRLVASYIIKDNEEAIKKKDHESDFVETPKSILSSSGNSNGNSSGGATTSSSPHDDSPNEGFRERKYRKKTAPEIDQDFQLKGKKKEITIKEKEGGMVTRQMEVASQRYQERSKALLQQKQIKRQKEIKKIFDGEGSNGKCLLIGARDPITGRPMRHPAMNRDGYVMDYESWEAFVNGKAAPPFETTIQSLSDLVLVTSKTYESLKMSIANFTCM